MNAMKTHGSGGKAPFILHNGMKRVEWTALCPRHVTPRKAPPLVTTELETGFIPQCLDNLEKGLISNPS
jgi:hypothetical protein